MPVTMPGRAMGSTSKSDTTSWPKKRLRAMAPDWHADDRAVILAAFGTADRLAAWLDTEPFGMAWRSYGADRLGRKVADAVRGGVVGQEVRA